MTNARTVMEKAIGKAIQSEELAAENLLAIAKATTDCAVRQRALSDAEEESRHALALRRAALRDGLVIPNMKNDGMMDELRGAFAELVATSDAAACSLAQDVLLEHSAIHLYEALLPAARVHAPTVARLIEEILKDEHEHVASAVEELGRLPLRDRARALRRAVGTLLPVMAKYGRVSPETACAKSCGACGDRCVRVDAESVGMPLRGGWHRLLEAAGKSLARIGLPMADVYPVPAR